VLTYEMLTGALPFAPGQTIFEWAERHLNVAPISIEAHPVAAQLSAKARVTLMQALEKEPDRRPASVLDFARGLIDKQDLESGWGLATARGLPAPRPVMPTTPMPASAPGLHLPPVAAPASVAAAPARAVGRAIGGLVAGAALVGAGGVAAAYFLWFADEPPSPLQPGAPAFAPAPATSVVGQPAVDPLPTSPHPASTTVPALPDPPAIEPPLPQHWLEIVHHEDRVEEASAATGAPDGRSARIASGGRLTLELLPGAVVSTDGGPGPDLYVAVDPRTSPYRIEVATGHDRFRVAVAEARGTLPVDLDQYRAGVVRYVRVSSRSPAPVLVDAIGVYRTGAPPAHHDHH
jgi:hypothetical protein